jgi:exopolyphosphatase/guanosine-5'-triphosphate,3'-diphosphate pyrophosphatase
VDAVNRAAIDIGSNSLLLTVVDGDGNVLHDESRVVGLGRGLGDRGLFAPDRLAAAEAVLTSFVQTSAAHEVAAWQIKAVATSGARRAMNASTWLARVQRRLGLRVRIATGPEEARLTWLGAVRGLDLPGGPRLVLDLGAGSTEIVLGDGDHVVVRESLEVGTMRCTEEFLFGRDGRTYDPAGIPRIRAHVDMMLTRVALDPAPVVAVAVAGTATTFATMVLGLSAWDGTAVHGTRVTREHLARFVDRLLLVAPDQRAALCPAAPERADWLLAGSVILDALLDRAGRDEFVTSIGGLRFGLLAM